MASPIDPYSILGLMRGASLADIKRAYRRLAKEYHPDWAGPGATARFLAIQEAYDALTGNRSGDGSNGSDGSGGVGGRGGGGGGGGTQGSTAQSPGDFGASFRRRRPGGAAEPGPMPFGQRSGAARPGEQASSGGSRRPWGPRRPPNKATLGSTTYDDAGEPEPGWEGAGWYGPATGTYWTINPREYADPRKHGPEYQARARRASDGGGGEGVGPDGEVRGAGASAPEPEAEAAAEAQAAPER